MSLLIRRRLTGVWTCSTFRRFLSSCSTQKLSQCPSCDKPSTSLVKTCKNTNALQTSFYPVQLTFNRFYAKGKNKGGKSKSSGKAAAVDDEEMLEIFDLAAYRGEQDKVLEHLKLELQQNMSLRTSTASFDRLMIRTTDGDIPLNQIASITQKGPSLIMLDLTRSGKYVAEVLKTLQESAMNLNPQQEKTHTIFVHIPKVSREHREKMANSAKKLFNDSKEKMSKVYAKYLKTVNSYSKTGNRTLAESAKSTILSEMKERVNKADSMVKDKQKELLA